MQQTGKLLPVYVKSRVPAALKTWQTDMENALSTAGLAIIMHHTDDLENYQRSEVNLIHKLYGMLLHPDGPLRNNRVLLKQVKDIVATRPKMHLHGARLYAQMCDGLRFVPAPRRALSRSQRERAPGSLLTIRLGLLATTGTCQTGIYRSVAELHV